jgi:flavin reductase (DIM6/NTAB) family NADH-FMN oxidoreductase RutF
VAVKSTEPLGPFPPGADPVEYDKLRRRVLWKFPSGLFVIGSRAGDRRNLMTANWVGQVSFEPKLVAVSVEKDALTHALIAEGRCFAVNVVDREDRAIVRKFTKPVDVAEYETHDSAVTGAPVLDGAVAYVDCRLHQTVEVGTSTLFVGEVVDAGFQKPEDTDVLRMEDTRMNYGG